MLSKDALVLPSCPPQKHFLMNSLMHIVSLCFHTLWQMVATNLYPHRQDSAFLIMTALKLFSQMKMPGESGRDIVQTFLICRKQQENICICHSCTDRNSLCGFDKKGTNIYVTWISLVKSPRLCVMSHKVQHFSTCVKILIQISHDFSHAI